MQKYFKWIGYSEGVSFLVLLFIAMPLKYIWDSPEWVRIVGMLHGVLFVLYVLAATYFAMRLKWRMTQLMQVYFAAVIPFGPFFIDENSHFIDSSEESTRSS